MKRLKGKGNFGMIFKAKAACENRKGIPVSSWGSAEQVETKMPLPHTDSGNLKIFLHLLGVS